MTFIRFQERERDGAAAFRDCLHGKAGKAGHSIAFVGSRGRDILPTLHIVGDRHSVINPADGSPTTRLKRANATLRGTRPSSQCRPDPASNLHISPTSAQRTPSDSPPSIF